MLVWPSGAGTCRVVLYFGTNTILFVLLCARGMMGTVTVGVKLGLTVLSTQGGCLCALGGRERCSVLIASKLCRTSEIILHIEFMIMFMLQCGHDGSQRGGN